MRDSPGVRLGASWGEGGGTRASPLSFTCRRENTSFFFNLKNHCMYISPKILIHMLLIFFSTAYDNSHLLPYFKKWTGRDATFLVNRTISWIAAHSFSYNNKVRMYFIVPILAHSSLTWCLIKVWQEESMTAQTKTFISEKEESIIMYYDKRQSISIFYQRLRMQNKLAPVINAKDWKQMSKKCKCSIPITVGVWADGTVTFKHLLECNGVHGNQTETDGER